MRPDISICSLALWPAQRRRATPFALSQRPRVIGVSRLARLGAIWGDENVLRIGARVPSGATMTPTSRSGMLRVAVLTVLGEAPKACRNTGSTSDASTVSGEESAVSGRASPPLAL